MKKKRKKRSSRFVSVLLQLPSEGLLPGAGSANDRRGSAFFVSPLAIEREKKKNYHKVKYKLRPYWVAIRSVRLEM